MAILVEEEKKPKNWFALVAVIIVVGIIFAGVYFVFFQKPEFIEIVAPKQLETISKLSRVKFDPTAVIDSPVFKKLRTYGSPLTLPVTGRDNPFLPF